MGWVHALHFTPASPGPLYSGSLLAHLGLRALDFGEVKMGDRSKAALLCTESLSLVYPFLPCCLRSPRAHLSWADLTPLLCVRIRAGSLVSIQISSGRYYMRLSRMN